MDQLWMTINNGKNCGAVMIIEQFCWEKYAKLPLSWELLKGHLLWKICFVLELWQLKEISKPMKTCFTGWLTVCHRMIEDPGLLFISCSTRSRWWTDNRNYLPNFILTEVFKLNATRIFPLTASFLAVVQCLGSVQIKVYLLIYSDSEMNMTWWVPTHIQELIICLDFM